LSVGGKRGAAGGAGQDDAEQGAASETVRQHEFLVFQQGFKAPVGLVAGATGWNNHERDGRVKKKACDFNILDHF
jgi:hypothetical protein